MLQCGLSKLMNKDLYTFKVTEVSSRTNSVLSLAKKHGLSAWKFASMDIAKETIPTFYSSLFQMQHV